MSAEAQSAKALIDVEYTDCEMQATCNLAIGPVFAAIRRNHEAPVLYRTTRTDDGHAVYLH